jgi:hypothetical protein
MVSLKQSPLICCEARFRILFTFLGSLLDAGGTVKKFSFWIIFVLISVLNSFTCFLIYLRKASLDQRPNIMIIITGTPLRYIAMAAPLRAEWSPICFAVNPRMSGPIEVVAARRHFGVQNLWIRVLYFCRGRKYWWVFHLKITHGKVIFLLSKPIPSLGIDVDRRSYVV